MNYKKADALLKTEDEMKHDYSIADYPYSKATYEYFVSLNQQSKPAKVNTQTMAGTYKNGIYKPHPDTVKLGQELRELFDKNKGR